MWKNYIFAAIICLFSINCSSYNTTKHPAILVDVIIENNTSETFFTGKLSGYSLHYGESEKIYYLINSINWDTSSISMDCYDSLYVYEIAIPGGVQLKMEINIFPFLINNEKSSFVIDNQYGIIEKPDIVPYNNDEIKFLIYYTTEPFRIQYYKNYVDHIKINGILLFGYLRNGVIHFEIN